MARLHEGSSPSGSRRALALRSLLASLVVWLAAVGCGATPAPGPAEAGEEAPPASPLVLALRFLEGPEDTAAGVPSTRVLLVDIDADRGRRTSDLGTYPGVCSHLTAGESALLRAQCFWVGQASRLEVVRDEAGLVVTRVVLDEGGAPGPRNTVLRLDLPPGATVEVLAPQTRLGAEPQP